MIINGYSYATLINKASPSLNWAVTLLWVHHPTIFHLAYIILMDGIGIVLDPVPTIFISFHTLFNKLSIKVIKFSMSLINIQNVD